VIMDLPTVDTSKAGPQPRSPHMRDDAFDSDASQQAMDKAAGHNAEVSLIRSVRVRPAAAQGTWTLPTTRAWTLPT
jgi:hypothetical protein